MKAISKEEFKRIEKKYNLWLCKHPKGDLNYKAFSHMRRSVEFAKHYSSELEQENARLSAEKKNLNEQWEEYCNDLEKWARTDFSSELERDIRKPNKPGYEFANND